MSKLLYIEVSPRKESSVSSGIAKHFLTEYRERNPEDEVQSINLWEEDLASLEGDVMDAKYAFLSGSSPEGESKSAWKAVEQTIAQFLSADKYLVSTPMWNFTVPYKLKHYIDILLQPGYTFGYSPEEGYSGLVTGKRVAIIYAHGGSYAPGTPAEPYDFETNYLSHIFGFIGITDQQAVVADQTLNPAAFSASHQRAGEEAKRVAASF